MDPGLQIVQEPAVPFRHCCYWVAHLRVWRYTGHVLSHRRNEGT